MRTRHFLDASYALLVEEYQRMGVNLVEALEKVDHLSAQKPQPDTPLVAPGKAAIARQNESSFNQFEQMMKGVKTS